MGGIFSKPSPPPPPKTDPEEERRAQALDAEEKRERKSIASRRKSRSGRSARVLMSVARASDIAGSGQGQQALNNTLGGVRNPRIG